MNFRNYKHLRVKRDKDTITVTLNRPERQNSVDSVMHTEFSKIFTEVRAESAKVIVITGAGDWFCNNGDPDWMPDEAEWLRIVREGKWMIHDAMTVPQPIIIAMNGNAMGFGCSVVGLGDIIVAASGARLGDHHTAMSVAAGDGGAAFYPLSMGPMRAKDMYLRNREFTAEELLEIGVVTSVVPREQLMAEAYGIADELASLPVESVQWTKWALNRNAHLSVMMTVDGAFAYEGWSRHLGPARSRGPK